jgi:hypothetical protein
MKIAFQEPKADFTGAMSKRFVCKACSKSCSRDAAHTCSDWIASPPRVQAGFESRARTVIDIFEVSHVSPTPSWNRETKRVFVTVNASANHVVNSLNLPENMNMQTLLRKRVKLTERDNISAIRPTHGCWYRRNLFKIAYLKTARS